jgi:outer membrane protein OmpA-like peptidoglycan-associated protein
VALAPVVPAPEAPSAPPPPPPVSNTSNSTASSNAAGLQVTFGSGQSDLSPASAAAIQNLVKSAPSGDGTSFNVVAYAAGTPEDPSTARRLSLSRALAVRSALMAGGIASSRIYVRALGAPEGDKTPDRAEVAVLGSNAPSTSKSAQP